VCLCAEGRLLFHLDPVVNTDITAVDECCIRQGLNPVLMPLPGLAPVSPYFGMRPVGRLSLPK